MKKYILLVYLLVLALTATSCIQAAPESPSSPPTPSDTSTNIKPPAGILPDDPDAPTSPDKTPTSPDMPSYPEWKGDDTTAQRFLQTEGIVDTSKKEYSYEEMSEDLFDLAHLYPTVFSYRSFGKSVLGRDLYVATLGNPHAVKQILVSAGIHGREYLTPLLVMKQIEFYLAYYENGSCGGFSYRSLFENVCFYIVPMTNPDGIMLSQGGIDTVTDRTARQKLLDIHMTDFRESLTKETNINEYLKTWKANANGVDLNRNYDARWDSYNNVTHPSHRNYKGPSPASEPETQAMIALINSIPNIQSVLCIHSQGEVLYWNCGQGTELKNETQQFTKLIAQLTGYYIVPNQNNDASLSDWCALQKEQISITIETGNGVCPLPISQFSDIWKQNYNLFAQSARYFS